MSKQYTEVEFSMASPEIDINNHRTLVKITERVIGGGTKVINVGTHYQLLDD